MVESCAAEANHQRLVAGLSPDSGIADLIVPDRRVRAQLRHHHRRPVLELHYRRHMKNVLIVPREEERLVALDRTSDRRSKLVLLIARIETHKRRRRSPQRTVAQDNRKCSRATDSCPTWSPHSLPRPQPAPTPLHNRSTARGTPAPPRSKTGKARDIVPTPAHKSRCCCPRPSTRKLVLYPRIPP